MDKIRIGNDIIVNWDITRIGKPEDLESKKLKLFLRTGFDKMEISDYSVKDSVISFNFYGKDQVHTGIYMCILVENLCVTVDALDNESMTDPLSARQGKLLNDRLTALETTVNKLMAGTF